MIGSSFYAIFLPSNDDSKYTYNKEAVEEEYKARKEKVEYLIAKTKEDPENVDLKIALADAYFEKSELSNQLFYDEYKDDINKSVEIYQSVLSEKEDSGTMLKLATAAFYQENYDLAEETYQKVLEKEDTFEVHYSYGMFQFYARKNYDEAISEWQKALKLASNEDNKENVQKMIDLGIEAKTSAGDQTKQETEADK